MDNGLPARSHAQTVRGGRLVETTPEVNREVAESAMLLSQGAQRAIEMRQDAEGGTAGEAGIVTVAAGMGNADGVGDPSVVDDPYPPKG